MDVANHLDQDDIEMMRQLIRVMARMAVEEQSAIRRSVEIVSKRNMLLTGLCALAVLAAILAAYATHTNPIVVGLIVLATALLVIILVLKILHIL